jgi:pimeloyl-ACP methyl ester carboxylesterase
MGFWALNSKLIDGVSPLHNRPTRPLPPPFAAEQLTLKGPAGLLTLYCAGEGPAVLLVHTVNAAASAAEVRPLFEALQKTHTVYAFDLPGYGLSERQAIRYTIRIMTDSVKLVAQWIQTQHQGAQIWGFGTSLSCEFIARCCTEDLSLFSALTLVSPTGFRGLKSYRGEPGSSRYVPWLSSILRGPRWGGFLFRCLTGPKVIRYFLERTWGSKHIDETLWQYDVLTTRAPNAEYAPLSFLTAALFAADIHTVYEQLALPVLAFHGTQGDFKDVRGMKMVAQKENWSIHAMEGGALPFFEKPVEFFGIVERWRAQLASNAALTTPALKV